MTTRETPIQQILEALQERAKELSCLYVVDEILADPGQELGGVGERIVRALPPGWRHPEACRARIRVRGVEAASPGFAETPWGLTASIIVEGAPAGDLAVHYVEERPLADDGPFLREERKLLDTIAQRIGFFIMRQDLRRAHESLVSASAPAGGGEPWRVVMEFLRNTDPPLLRRITRRMINHLELAGVAGSGALLRRFLAERDTGEEGGDNVPARRLRLQDMTELSEEAFQLASRELGTDEIVSSIRSWIEEDRSSFLIEVLEDQTSSLPAIIEAVGRHRNLIGGTGHLPPPIRTSISAALLRRLFTDEVSYIHATKDVVALEDVFEVADRIVHPPESHGKLGGKAAGLFLASQVLRGERGTAAAPIAVRFPRAWYVSSDVLLEFLAYNDLRDLYFRKYMDIEHVRQEYPHIVHVLKNSYFPPEISRRLAIVLEDLEDRPIIVRSSSLLEDRPGSSFAGKYKSLFLANRGSRKQRLAALEDAIAEIYASVFSPDPIEYRAERGLLDVHEEMAVIIQEVVGTRVGPWFLPAFSGVAFSSNELRWSPRIRREDGLVRIVPGLGTRAVDRVGDDYPVLLCPGQPGLRVNVSPDEVIRYAPRSADAINLETSSFETVEIRRLLREHGDSYPLVRQIVSLVADGRIRRPSGLEPDFAKDEVVVTFEGLVQDTPFVARIKEVMDVLKGRLGRPVDIEFASDGTDLYLLQCRTQSRGGSFAPAPIPRNIPRDALLFAASRNVSNGQVPEITHVVYVDPERYAALPTERELREVGRIVGRLNKLLPRRRFVLLGPGRWGSRGDIRLGVRVTYADISNTAALLEIARRTGSYVPELSFGTHFFQDLVEADIRYVPLYPDEPGGHLDELFLRRARNVLPEILPDAAPLADVVRVIDVAAERNGRILRILLNSDLDEGVGIFDIPRSAARADRTETADAAVEPPAESHWRWRLRMAERLASELDAARFGVRALYLLGSVKNGTAGPGSDVDLLVHDEGAGARRDALALWLEGWSAALAEMNRLRTGYRTEGLLDVHYVTDEDIERQSSFAARIGAVTDAARPLRLGPDRGEDA